MNSLVGVVLLIGIAILCSSNRRAINLKTIGVAFLLQAGIAALVFYSDLGKNALQALSQGVTHVISYGNVGVEFVFGDLARQKVGFVVALNVLAVIIFFSALISVLYYLKIMPRVIAVLGGGISKLLGTSKTESVSAAGNIFVGLTEAPLVVKPYIRTMTKSELFAVMVGGLASTAGAMLAGYASLGIEVKHLVAASFMAAPGGLLMAKIIFPENETPVDSKHNDFSEQQEDQPSSIFEAITNGALAGLKLAASIAALLIAFVALIAMVNGLFGYLGSLAGYPQLSLQVILAYIFSPLAYAIGVPWSESLAVGQLLGEKLVVNEFVAFISLQGMSDLSEHSRIIATFALCGFANLGSLAILLGGLGTMAPSRRADISNLGLKAVLAATLANLMSAALAGLFLTI
ncbi:transporter [Glaciecola punicea]|jgi:CNT family concentrative nucleoside transporter|uniref:NupC/NupG family nucleoside CNT transporter n=1 Tax=Glaciecola punicea TaxID=56804 RepID=UPI000872A9D2|nr:NupC/NupG family nucleoside CNT transporter [Glaciecola punicea]OFA29933.1 transporter [Glaciecola punicea]